MNNTAGLTKQVNDTASLQQQINDINYKLDRLLDYMHEQKLKSAAIDDLVADISIIGKDVYDTAVTELETSQVRIDPDEVKLLMVKLVKNVPTFLKLMETGKMRAFDPVMAAMEFHAFYVYEFYESSLAQGEGGRGEEEIEAERREHQRLFLETFRMMQPDGSAR
jgi:hypothetical protein